MDLEALKLVLEACKDIGGDAATVAIWYFAIPLVETVILCGAWIGVAWIVKICLSKFFTYLSRDTTTGLTNEQITLLTDYERAKSLSGISVHEYFKKTLGADLSEIKVDALKRELDLHSHKYTK
ncbi:hypothetical protein KAU11_08270 [Candidatus Babeliales bacterium]|nr:hypothetical protein [Candidatus Babeliales bacterium]